MAINFPNSPSTGDTHTAAGVKWEYDGEKWVSQASGGGGGGGASVTVSDTAPASPSQGDLWWDSSDDAGVLFIWYDDADGGQWVETSGTGQDVPLWTRTGTTLSPATAGDSVDIGSGNIKLNTDGSASFTDEVLLGGTTPNGHGASAGYPASIIGNATQALLSFAVSGSTPGTQGFVIGYDTNTATFVNRESKGFRWDSGGSNIARMTNTGSLQLGGADVLNNPNILLNADGNVFLIGVYNSTNSTISANVGVFSNGQLRRITSSSKYKTDIEDITDEYADKALQLRPVWYRSLCEGDGGKSSYGFIAEEVAQVDPRLASYDSDGNPDGVNYGMLVVHLTDIAQRQIARIEALEAKLAALEGGTN